MLRFPLGIKKVLLLSAEGITDYNITGTNFYQDNSTVFIVVLYVVLHLFGLAD